MQIEIIRNVTHKETIEVELPHYYKHAIDSDHVDSTIYGMICADRYCSIQFSHGWGTKDQSVEIETGKSVWRSLSAYLTDEEYLSNRAEFLSAYTKATEMLNSIPLT